MQPSPREILPIPDAVVDPTTGKARLGSFRGGFSRVDLSATASPLLRWVARKRWVYVIIAKPPLLVAACVVDLSYSGTAFAFAYDSAQKRMLADVSSLGMRARVSDTAQAGCFATFHSRALSISFGRKLGETTYSLEVDSPAFDVRAIMDSASAPPSLTAVSEVGRGRVSTTEKRALLSARGTIRIGNVDRSLDGGLAAYDYTHGVLPRRTRWNWAFLLGSDDRGEPIAVNLVQGFMGESECAAFSQNEIHPLAEGRFTFDRERPLGAWKVDTTDDRTTLGFSPGAVHQERKNLGIVRSRFIQPVGTFSGTIDLGSRLVRVAHALGVVEDQDVLW